MSNQKPINRKGVPFMSSKTDIKEIMKSLEDGIANLMNSEQYMNFLKTMSIFHGYSLNNTILIMLQRPDASLVAGEKRRKINYDSLPLFY